MAKSCMNGNYFLILMLLVFIMLLYVYIGVERYNNLVSPNKMIVVQGLTAQDVSMESTLPDDDISAPVVDGTEDGPRSKFLFAYNECKPECCATSGGYMCSGGCPCITKEQEKFFSSRGYNYKPAKCIQNYEMI